MTKTALITGITGQDGSYLAELLITKGYQVHGIKRRSSSLNTSRIDHLYTDPHEKGTKLLLHHGDLSDATNIVRVIQSVQPDEIYNLGAMSHVHVSFETPEYTGNVDAMGTLRLLESLRILQLEKTTRLYNAATSELYGKVQEIPQRETTPFYPRSPYAVAKQYSFWITKNYREAYGMFACNGILFNHESPRRGETFVTRKITRGVAEIGLGHRREIYLGNLNAERDWGHARDYVRAMWLMLQQAFPDDYVIATGKKHSVRDFLVAAFDQIGIRLAFSESGVNETAVIDEIDRIKLVKATGELSNRAEPKAGQVVVRVDPFYFRPTEVDILLGDASKAKRDFAWQPIYGLQEIVSSMVQCDIEEIRDGASSDYRNWQSAWI